MAFQIPTRVSANILQKLPQTISLSCQAKQQPKSPLEEDIKQLCQSALPILKEKKYPPGFVRIALLIKLNSIASAQSSISQSVLFELLNLYNKEKMDEVYVSKNQSEFFSQIIQKILDKVSVQTADFQNMMEGNSLLAASALWITRKARDFLRKQQIGFTLSFLSLGGRQMAFTEIVHIQKNHKGEINYANRIRKLSQVNNKFQTKESKVQDPYSMRCSPQIYGIAYDCLEQLELNLEGLLNKPHLKYICIGGKKLPNLLLQSDAFTLKIDNLINCIQQIGATMHLRSQRILNKYLGKNKLWQKKQYQSLTSMLKSSTSVTSKNKILCEMTNFDSMNIGNYQNDIFYNSGSLFNKIEQLFSNMQYLLTLQILCSVECLKQFYGEDFQRLDFVSDEMDKSFLFIKSNLSIKDRTGSLEKIRGNQWIF